MLFVVSWWNTPNNQILHLGFVCNTSLSKTRVFHNLYPLRYCCIYCRNIIETKDVKCKTCVFQVKKCRDIKVDVTFDYQNMYFIDKSQNQAASDLVQVP